MPREKKHRLPSERYRGIVQVHFTCAVQDRHRPFTDEFVVGAFLTHLAEQSARFGCDVTVYCFMPDHLHLILLGKSEAADCKRAIDSFKYKTGLWFGKHLPSCRWQKDYYDHIIRDHDDFVKQVSYVIRNPVDAGLAEDFRSYKFLGSIGVKLEDVMMDF